jgi:putative membrane protein
MSRQWPVGILCFAPVVAFAHVPQGDSPASDVGVVVVAVLLLIPVLLYGAGLARCWRRGAGHGVRATRTACFAGGMLALAACLLPPLDTWSATRFAAHMIQHELLMLVAAPLLVLGRPLPVFLWAFSGPTRARLAAWTRAGPVSATWRMLMHPATGWTAHALALWVWHVPVLFHAALEDRLLHDLQHLTFTLTALLFWSGLLLARSARRLGAAVLYLFTTTVHTGVLGALITFATRPWYVPDSTFELPDALQDQQLGGLIMWVPGSMVYVGAGLVLLLQWVRRSEA